MGDRILIGDALFQLKRAQFALKSNTSQQMPLLALSPFETVHRRGILTTVLVLQPVLDVLKHGTWRL